MSGLLSGLWGRSFRGPRAQVGLGVALALREGSGSGVVVVGGVAAFERVSIPPSHFVASALALGIAWSLGAAGRAALRSRASLMRPLLCAHIEDGLALSCSRRDSC